MYKVIEKNKMNIDTNNKYILIEIISDHYNIDCKYKLRCTNCSNITELGNTLFGKIIIIEKKNIDLDCVFKWAMIKNNKNHKNHKNHKNKYNKSNIISKPNYINV